jgi:Tol biopolymer transport system component
VTSPPERSERTEVEVDAAMFFLQWDPTSRRVAYLGSVGDAIGAGFAEPHADGGPVSRRIGLGQPFYLSWAPRGDRLLVHVGDETLGRLDLEGELVELGERPGLFHAPVWLEDGRLVYVTGGSGRQALVVRDGSRARVLHRFRGAIEFVVSPDGRRIAFRVDAGEGFAPVSLVAVDGGEPEVIADVPAAAFEWSPDGRRLLVLAVESVPDGAAGHWYVWDGRAAEAVGPRFLPSPTWLREYLPFFGQYTQTMTFWAPDGRSFAYPALIGDRDGIWVQDVDTEEPSLVLEDGSIVAWSPVDL